MERIDLVFALAICATVVLGLVLSLLGLVLPETGVVRGLVDFITWLLEETSYVGIIVLMTLESACVPIPSEIIMPFAGFLVSRGVLDFVAVVLAGTVGNLLGSLLAYWLGLKYGREFISRFGRWLLMSHSHLELAERLFEKYGDVIVLASRMMPAVRTFISLPAGVGRMRLDRFCLYTFVGSLPWNVALTYAGVVLGAYWDRIYLWMRKLDVFLLMALVLALAWFIMKGRVRETAQV